LKCSFAKLSLALSQFDFTPIWSLFVPSSPGFKGKNQLLVAYLIEEWGVVEEEDDEY